MIQKISSIGVINNSVFTNKVKKENKNITNSIRHEQNNNLDGVPASYINFKGVESKKELMFTQDAAELLSIAKTIAFQNGNPEVTAYHVIQAAIIENEDKFNKFLDSKEFDDSEEISTLHKLANSFAKKNVLATEEGANYYDSEVEILNDSNSEGLNLLPKVENLKPEDINLSEDLVEKLKNIPIDIDGYSLLGTAFNVLTFQQINYTSDFLKGFASLGIYKSGDEIFKDYLQNYDSKAIDVWNKLALGSSLFVTTHDEKEKDRIVASIVNTLNNEKHGNFNSENTFVYVISNDVEPQVLIDEVETIRQATPDKKLIYIVNMDDLLTKLLVEKPTGDIEYKKEIYDLPNLDKGNVKFIYLEDDKLHYQLMSSPSIKKSFSKFIKHRVPPIQSYEVNDILKKNKAMLKEVNKTFSPEARDKAILLADKMEGCYPEKAIDMMKRISEYYGDGVKKITGKEVDEFAYIANDLFNLDEERNAVVYNTGKTLDTYYGKATTKKDIEALVKRIKTGRIGTQGILLYSKDIEAGSGKKHTAEVIAGEAIVPFLEINASDFAVSMRDEELDERISSANRMIKIFSDIKTAAKENPDKTAVLYINNFEELAFLGSYYPGYKQALSQLSREMEKAIKDDINILVIGGTYEECVEGIPVAIKGFNQTIAVDSPAFNKQSRKEVITNLIEEKKIPLAGKTKEEKEDLVNTVVKLTEYLSFVNIKSLLNKTAQIMVERDKKRASIGEFIEAFLQIYTGRTSLPEMPMYNKRITTSHECGHATNLEVMNNLYKSKNQPWYQFKDVNFITLDPRGDFLGAVFQGDGDNTDYPFEAMFASIVCAYGGHSCEKQFFDMDGSAGISQDLAMATSAAKRGVEYFGLGHHTGKISNAAKLSSGKYNENVYTDIEVILKNAQMVSDLITETYKDFNIWFTDKYAKLIGSDNCMIDGDEFRKQLKTWIASQPAKVKEEIAILEDMILDIIKSSKNGKIYYQAKKVIR